MGPAALSTGVAPTVPVAATPQKSWPQENLSWVSKFLAGLLKGS